MPSMKQGFWLTLVLFAFLVNAKSQENDNSGGGSNPDKCADSCGNKTPSNDGAAADDSKDNSSSNKKPKKPKNGGMHTMKSGLCIFLTLLASFAVSSRQGGRGARRVANLTKPCGCLDGKYYIAGNMPPQKNCAAKSSKDSSPSKKTRDKAGPRECDDSFMYVST
ncbi:UNVERIFIED_CONTAM: hypothetical protein PYX00_011824 [Menopon gallinae]|uniref:Uncharacterized protein n=1 Tax=Menopon gallinae TaxID=328185 RepID=A0AAW2H8J0_9NEOP